MQEDENIKLAFFLNLGFAIFEFIGGIFTNSVSIFSDAIHDLGDSLSIGLSYLLEKISYKKNDTKYTFGYKRYSVFGAFITSMVLIISSTVVLIFALIRLFHPSEVHVTGMFFLAIFGILINGYAMLKTSSNINLNEKSVNLHMFEDVLGWIAVLIGTFLIKITGSTLIDPLLSIGISLIIGYKTIKNLIDILNILLEKVPDSIDLDFIKSQVLSLDKVKDVHHIHVWTIDGNDSFLTMHVLLDKSVTKKNYDGTKESIKGVLEKNGIHHSTIELEYEKCNDTECE